MPPQIPTFLQVADICRIVERSGLNDRSNLKNLINRVTADNSVFIVANICRIVKRSGLNDSDNFK